MVSRPIPSFFYRMPMSPKDGGAPWSGSNDGGEFGEELKRAHEHQNSKMAAETAALAGAAAAAAAMSGEGAGGGGGPAGSKATLNSATTSADAGNRDPSEETAIVAVSGVPDSELADDPPPPASEEPPVVDNGGVAGGEGVEENPTAPPPPAGATAEDEGPKLIEAMVEGAEDVNGAAAVAAAAAGGAEMAELEPGKVRVRALYDYDATQDGDLSFGAGDMIITDGGAFSGDGWVSGTCHGNTGIFPANYTEPW